MNSSTTTAAVRIDVWDDYVCPFCFLAQPMLARIEEVFAGQLEIHSRAFELRPDPEPTLDPKGDYLRDIWARSVYPMAQEQGLRIHLPPVQPRSRLAHELTAFARTRNKGVEVHHALFEAFFQEGEDIGKVDVLVQIAANAGLDEDLVRRALTQNTFRAGVLADEQLAAKLRISGVPSLAIRAFNAPIEEALILRGVQPFKTVHGVLEEFVHSGAN